MSSFFILTFIFNYVIIHQFMPICQICNKEMKMITNSHLKHHNISINEYQIKFPHADILSQDIRTKYSNNAKNQNSKRDYSSIGEKISKSKGGIPSKNKDKPLSQTHKDKISISQKQNFQNGFTHWNKNNTTPEETRNKISKAVKNAYNLSDLKIQRKLIRDEKINLKKQQQINNLQKITEHTNNILTSKNLVLLNKESISIRTDVKLHCNICNTDMNFTRQMIDLSKIHYIKCRTCNPLPTTSKAQIEIFDYIKTLQSDVILNDRFQLGGKEIDIFIPSKNVGFEYNGLYWHSIAHNPDIKHLLNKQQFAYNKNIQLYHIFEDEWLVKPEIVKSRIRQILQLQTYKLDARKCSISRISASDSNKFLDEHHLQGHDKAGVRYGLFDDGLVAVMTFKKSSFVKGGNGEDWELSRFAVKIGYTIRGGANRLLKHFEIDYKPSLLITYADKRWSQGNLYYKLGFTFKHISPPCFWYIKNNTIERLHRSNYMRHKLNGFPDDMTGNEIMASLGYTKIFDCGNLVFVKHY